MTGLTGTMGGACYFKESEQERLVHLKLIKKNERKKKQSLEEQSRQSFKDTQSGKN